MTQRRCSRFINADETPGARFRGGFLGRQRLGRAAPKPPVRVLSKWTRSPRLCDDSHSAKPIFSISGNPAKTQIAFLRRHFPLIRIAESRGFERTYRLHGAVTNADKYRRYGNYFDFFWRAKRPANVTVRLEYRQEKLRAFLQAREISYANAKENQKTEFAIIGDDYMHDGRVISWRCLLIENGRIVAENRSFYGRPQSDHAEAA